MKTSRILLIGLDAAERDLLIRWSDSGELPNLKQLRENSLEAELEVIPGFGSGAMWPTFATGVSPAGHGRYFGHAQQADYSMRKEVHEIQAPPFWQTLSAAGLRVAITNIPYARPTPDINGIEVLDWATHNPVVPEPLSIPPELAAEVRFKYGDDPVGPCDMHGDGQDDLSIFRDRLLQRVASKTEMAADLLSREDWNFYATVFDESHCVGHQAWHVHDPGHPRHNTDQANALGDPVKDVYKAIDAGIGRLASLAGPETLIVIAGITGMGPNYNANWLLDDILRPLEAQESNGRLRLISTARTLWRMLPESLRHAVGRKAGNFAEKNIRATERSRRPAYALPHNDISGAIRLNVKGREPNGHIEPGSEYDNYLQRIRDHLAGITNAETGEPLVARIIEPRKIMHGEHLEKMPDLMLEWNRNAPIRSIHIPGVGKLDNPYKGNRLGDHTTHGLFLASGPGIAKSKLGQPVSVMDLAPSLCAALGVRLDNVQGRTISELAA